VEEINEYQSPGSVLFFFFFTESDARLEGSVNGGWGMTGKWWMSLSDGTTTTFKLFMLLACDSSTISVTN